jgi:hypothetical protein
VTDPGRAVPPVPTNGAGGKALVALQEARHEAVQAMLMAESAEREARQQRGHAKRMLRVYERLLNEYRGQLTLPDS